MRTFVGIQFVVFLLREREDTEEIFKPAHRPKVLKGIGVVLTIASLFPRLIDGRSRFVQFSGCGVWRVETLGGDRPFNAASSRIPAFLEQH